MLPTCPPIKQCSDEPSNAIDDGGASDETGVMVEVPILRPQDKDSNKGIEKIRKGSVERPEGLDSVAATSTSVKRKVCGRDLGCEFGKGLLE